jgi:hypothetical protein
VPASVLGIFPTTRVPGASTGTPPASTEFVLLAGDQDEIVGTAGADDLRAWLENMGPASTETFWAPVDELIADARSGR